MHPILEVSGLGKDYGALRAVDDLSFTLAPGEIVGLLGPNGAGKTTTLRCLAGILPPTAGQVRVAGHGMAEDAVGAKRELAFVPDEPRLFDHLTVDEHLGLVARLYGLERWEARAEGLLGELELQAKRTALPAELSRGMRQKLLLSCALLHEPRVVLLDEPLTGLDPLAIRNVKAALRQRAAAGAAILLSSHLLPVVEELCERVLVLAGGRCVASGTIEAIRARGQDGAAGGTLEEVFLELTAPAVEPRS